MIQPVGAPLGKQRNPIAVPLLSLITLGIYWLVYVYKTSGEIKTNSGIGVGAGVALIIAFFVGIVTPFLLGSDVGNLRARAGQPNKVSAITAFWILIPIAGYFIYEIKVQGALNEYWQSQGG